MELLSYFLAPKIRLKRVQPLESEFYPLIASLALTLFCAVDRHLEIQKVSFLKMEKFLKKFQILLVCIVFVLDILEIPQRLKQLSY